MPDIRESKPSANWVEAELERIKRGPGYTVVGLLAAFVLFVGNVTDSLDGTITFFHDRCRDIHVCPPPPPPPPPWLVGTLSEVRLGAANVPQAQANRERNLGTPVTWTPRVAAWPGRFVTFRVEFQGMLGADCFARWTLLDAATGQRVEDQWSSAEQRPKFKTLHAIAYPDSKFTVEANEVDAAVGTLWVPYLAPGTYVVEVELLDADGTYLDMERTPPFTVTAHELPA